MIEREENKECPFCLSRIREGDDYVPCPKCGVEHHAECWERNGKCSVQKCDGWARWNGAIAKRMAPKLDGSVDLSTDLSASEGVDTAEMTRKAQTARPATKEVSNAQRCIKCGTEVPAQTLLCGGCRRAPGHFWENCSGPALVFLAGVIGITTLIVRALA